jgi:hypothetical protein
MTFFVTGLPRSRTAWLANFLTYGDSLCYHEALNGCKSITEYIDKVDGCGDSNTYLGTFDYEKYFPDSKVVIIDSGIEKSVQFGKDVYNSDSTELTIKYKKKLDSMKGLHVHIDNLNSSLEEIWNYIYNEPFNKKRTEMLIELNVQMLDPHAIDTRSIAFFNKSIDNSLSMGGF